MGLKSGRRGSESRFTAYVEALSSALGHADRARPFHSYCAGLLLPGDRKSVEPMAARVQPGRVQAAHQSLHHFVAKREKAKSKQTDTAHGARLPVHSLQTFLADLATLTRNNVRIGADTLSILHTTPTQLQRRAFELLGVTLET